MKNLLVLAFLLITNCVATDDIDRMRSVPSASNQKLDVDSEFNQNALLSKHSEYPTFLAHTYKYNKQYQNSTEHFYRFQIYLDNLKFIEKHNSDKTQTYTVEMNEFGDMTTEEFIEQYSNLNIQIDSESEQHINPTLFTNYSNSQIDFRQNGDAVNWVGDVRKPIRPIQDQKTCGGCWAFSTIGAIESINTIKCGKTDKLSEQQLVDCVTTNYGCNGGNMVNAYNYVIGAGVNFASDYPYVAMRQTCKYSTIKSQAHISGFKAIPSGDENTLVQQIYQQPISVAIDATGTGFQLYQSGIYRPTTCSSKNLSHAVLLVGYGVEGGIIYYRLRNSWGTQWGEPAVSGGERGYMRIGKGVNVCGIATMASYPITNC